MIERHHEILRQTYLRLVMQAHEEGLACSEQHLLTCAVTAKNALFYVAGVSLTQAVFSRQSGTLPDIERAATQLDDTHGAPDGLSRGRHRLRELAAQSMIEETAKHRIALALKSKTRVTAQALELKVGDEVEFYRIPAQKDMQGWRGPAEVLKVEDDGVIHIKWQGGTLTCRSQDIRRPLLYLSFVADYVTTEARTSPSLTKPLDYLYSLVHNLEINTSKTIVILGRADGYRLSKYAQVHPRALHAALAVAACDFHLRGCCGIRIARGMKRLVGFPGVPDSLIVFYCQYNPLELFYIFVRKWCNQCARHVILQR